MGFKFRITPLHVSKPSMAKEYDVIIVGGGPAGLSAALYSARYQLKTIIITKIIGGLVTEAPLVDDYLGIPNIVGNELVKRFVNHVRRYNVPIIVDEVISIYRKDNKWCIKTRGSSEELCSYAVILAMGSEKRKLGVPGEDKLSGKGVSYCATCDGPLFKDKVVAVVGGGNSALSSALYLSSLASKVYIIHRRDQFRAFKTYVDRASRDPKIEFILNTVVTEIIGEEKLEAVKILNKKTSQESLLKIDGLFIEIGSIPPREFFEKIGLEVDENGYAIVKPDQSTNQPGIFVAGDAAGGPYKYRFEQILTAAAEGAKAADAAFKYIMRIDKNGPGGI